MAITYKDTEFNVVDNGDGTFTLTPVSAVVSADLIAEYRAFRNERQQLVKYRQKLQGKVAAATAELLALRDKRDALKALLEAAGETPDSDVNLEPSPGE